MSNNPTQINPQEELKTLYAQKGEVVTQLEIGQAQLMQINQRLNQLIGIQVPQVQR